MKIKDKIAVLVVFIISSTLFVYLIRDLLGRISILVFKKETTAKVISLIQDSGDCYIVYQFYAEGSDYKIKEKINVPIYKRLENAKEIKIHYSSIWPEYTLIEGRNNYPIIYLFIGTLIVAFSSFRCIQVFRRKITPSDLM